MVGAVAGRAVGVPVAIVPRQDPVQEGLEVGFGAGSEFHERQPGGGVRHEHVDQPVAAPGAEPTELRVRSTNCCREVSTSISWVCMRLQEWRGGVTEPGGGMVPGPETLQASALGSTSSSGSASRGGLRNDGCRRSIMSSMALALASR